LAGNCLHVCTYVGVKLKDKRKKKKIKKDSTKEKNFHDDNKNWLKPAVKKRKLDLLSDGDEQSSDDENGTVIYLIFIFICCSVCVCAVISSFI
jgi:hypothetical protein